MPSLSPFAPPLVACPHSTRALVNAVDAGLCPICSTAEAADLRERVVWAEALLRPVAGEWWKRGDSGSTPGWEQWVRRPHTGWYADKGPGPIAYVLRWYPLQGPGWEWYAVSPLGRTARGVVGSIVEFDRPKINLVELWRLEAMRQADAALHSWGVFTREEA